MAATRNNSTNPDFAPVKRRLAELDKQSRDADLAALDYPDLPDCMRKCAQNRLRRLEEAKWKAGPQKTLPLTIAD